MKGGIAELSQPCTVQCSDFKMKLEPGQDHVVDTCIWGRFHPMQLGVI